MTMVELILFLAAAFTMLWWVFHWCVKKCEAANEVDWGSKWLNRLDGLNRIFCRKYHRLICHPIPLPDTDAAIVVSNHVSGLDPLLMVAAASRPLRFMIAREEYERFGLQWLFRAVGCIPVDRSGRPDLALREALRALRMGEVVALFPHGRIHVDEHAPPPKLKGGVIRLAQKSHSLIYPVRIEGVKGKGHTLLAVPLRSHARLTSYSPLSCEGRDHYDCLDRVARILHMNDSDEEA